jgi:Chaperone for flagella basal body P-ring formation
MHISWAAAPAIAIMVMTAGGNHGFAQTLSVHDDADSKIFAEIHDAATGDHWLLEHDPSHPGGPGRLVRIADGEAASIGKPEMRKPVIHAGDRVVVEANTVVVNARLEGTATDPACAGSALKVRLAIGGRVVHAVALAPGRAALITDDGKRR